METVSSYAVRTRNDGTTFIALELSGGVELVQSNNSGKFYATVRKTSIPSTFNETIAKGLIGSQMPGSIVRVQVDPYQFVNQRTGEVLTLQHSFSYQQECSTELIGQTQISKLEMA